MSPRRCTTDRSRTFEAFTSRGRAGEGDVPDRRRHGRRAGRQRRGQPGGAKAHGFAKHGRRRAAVWVAIHGVRTGSRLEWLVGRRRAPEVLEAEAWSKPDPREPSAGPALAYPRAMAAGSSTRRSAGCRSSRRWSAASTRASRRTRSCGRCTRRRTSRGARHRLTLFLSQYWGGPTTYSDERGHPALRMRHAPFADRRRGAGSLAAAHARGDRRLGRPARRRGPAPRVRLDGGRGDAQPTRRDAAGVAGPWAVTRRRGPAASPSRPGPPRGPRRGRRAGGARAGRPRARTGGAGHATAG